MARKRDTVVLARRSVLTGGLALAATRSVWAQGFAGLSDDADGFALPDPAYQLIFPHDHGAHPEFRTEWWYLTATLVDASGRHCGVQWTLFRSALEPVEAKGWTSPQIWMGHAALTSSTVHRFAERFARGGIGQAGVTADPFAAWIDDWTMKGRAGEGLSHLDLTARGDDFAYNLTLSADGPLVLHGQNGFSEKALDGRASHYYSQPAFTARGVVTFPGEDPVAVTGRAWLDREWSSAPMAVDQKGWDWFALDFTDGTQLMAARMRGTGTPFTAATWIGADGKPDPYPDGALKLTPGQKASVAGREVPVEWHLALPARGIDVTVRALNPDAWMGTAFAYWEGPVEITDRRSGEALGRGYLEMTGYD
ncbi:lipocalin-like domain-containing protein [Chachezhania sediminis]|uniref:lipocalin-like domain-containing protein n=1 Tax=Chachezhania sediminis TaxID=2599291 RepID=UPI00131D9636|nr:lipocalin-like domain-containing protein [Chachezhania sediminis]